MGDPPEGTPQGLNRVELRFRPEARLDVLQAQAWSEGQVPGLGSEFARAVDGVAAGMFPSPARPPDLGGPDLASAFCHRPSEPIDPLP